MYRGCLTRCTEIDILPATFLFDFFFRTRKALCAIFRFPAFFFLIPLTFLGNLSSTYHTRIYIYLFFLSVICFVPWDIVPDPVMHVT
jgi:hypothetical protein